MAEEKAKPQQGNIFWNKAKNCFQKGNDYFIMIQTDKYFYALRVLNTGVRSLDTIDALGVEKQKQDLMKQQVEYSGKPIPMYDAAKGTLVYPEQTPPPQPQSQQTATSAKLKIKFDYVGIDGQGNIILGKYIDGTLEKKFTVEPQIVEDSGFGDGRVGFRIANGTQHIIVNKSSADSIMGSYNAATRQKTEPKSSEIPTAKATVTPPGEAKPADDVAGKATTAPGTPAPTPEAEKPEEQEEGEELFTKETVDEMLSAATKPLEDKCKGLEEALQGKDEIIKKEHERTLYATAIIQKIFSTEVEVNKKIIGEPTIYIPLVGDVSVKLETDAIVAACDASGERCPGNYTGVVNYQNKKCFVTLTAKNGARITHAALTELTGLEHTHPSDPNNVVLQLIVDRYVAAIGAQEVPKEEKKEPKAPEKEEKPKDEKHEPEKPKKKKSGKKPKEDEFAEL